VGEPRERGGVAGVRAFAQLTRDRLRQHLYSVLLDFNWKTLLPSYHVRYENRVLLASLEALIARDGLNAHQSVTTEPIALLSAY